MNDGLSQVFPAQGRDLSGQFFSLRASNTHCHVLLLLVVKSGIVLYIRIEGKLVKFFLASKTNSIFIFSILLSFEGAVSDKLAIENSYIIPPGLSRPEPEYRAFPGTP